MNIMFNIRVAVMLPLFVTLFCNVSGQERVSPESQGVSSKDVKECFDSLMNIAHGEVHDVVVMRHGKVLAELCPKPFVPEYRHTLYSVSKTFVGVAVGLAIDENRLRLTDRVATFFPEMMPDSISVNLAAMTVRDLLTMTSGVTPDWNMRNVQEHWLKYFFGKPVQKPGVEFKYDSMASYVLSAIVQRVTGMKVIDYLNKKVFSVLNINDAEWECSPEGISAGGWGLRLSALSMAKFGQLLLDKGRWNGVQVVSEEWVRLMMSEQQVTSDGGFYGFHIWKHDGVDGAYRADGAFGQYIIIAPKEDMVVSVTQSNRGNGIIERRLIDSLIIRKAQNVVLKEGKDLKLLRAALQKYTMPLVGGKASLGKFSVFEGEEIWFADNDMGWKSMSLKKKGNVLNISIGAQDGKRISVEAGNKEWRTLFTDVCPPYSIKAKCRFEGISRNFAVAACYGREKDALVIKILFPDWISGVVLTITEKNGFLNIEAKENFKKNSYKL